MDVFALVVADRAISHGSCNHAAEGDLRHLHVQLWGFAIWSHNLETGLAVNAAQYGQCDLEESEHNANCVLHGTAIVAAGFQLLRPADPPVKLELGLRDSPSEKPHLVVHRVVGDQGVSHADEGQSGQHAPLEFGLAHASDEPARRRAAEEAGLGDHAVRRRVDACHSQHLAHISQGPTNASGSEQEDGPPVDALPDGPTAARGCAQQEPDDRDHPPRHDDD
mmetsp:Transcript_130609/g.325909  ORF Transcript_130609/g.325909 Transcript_130609/m.325909 type:complete len:222 (-) Transcript_130609:677-1342(-)